MGIKTLALYLNILLMRIIANLSLAFHKMLEMIVKIVTMKENTWIIIHNRGKRLGEFLNIMQIHDAKTISVSKQFTKCELWVLINLNVSKIN